MSGDRCQVKPTAGEHLQGYSGVCVCATAGVHAHTHILGFFLPYFLSLPHFQNNIDIHITVHLWTHSQTHT